MPEPVYINGIGCISIQPTWEKAYFFDQVKAYTQNPIPAYDPDYKTQIPPIQLRRLGKSMRMALFASRLALTDAGIPQADAIITGTGMGCLRDSERFVESLIENREIQLNPTPFIQSTHNMAASAIALALGCKGYNMTYVHNASSFESAVLDAQLYLQEHPSEKVILGGVDELGETTTQFWDRAGYLKADKTLPLAAPGKESAGEIAAEGAAFFVLVTSPGQHTYGKLSGVQTRYTVEDSVSFIRSFLAAQQLEVADIDTILVGSNSDSRYDDVYQTAAHSLFSNTAQAGYKHVFGEYDTVSAAAVWLGARILKEQMIPEVLQLNNVPVKHINNLLIYQQRRGKNHSLILLQR